MDLSGGAARLHSGISFHLNQWTSGLRAAQTETRKPAFMGGCAAWRIHFAGKEKIPLFPFHYFISGRKAVASGRRT
jgi:hypothetical protein